MLCSRCVLPLLTLYLLLEEISAAVLPSRFRNKREVNLLDQELFSRLPDDSDLSVGDAGDVDGHRFHSETFLAPTEHFFLQRQHQNQNQFQYQRKAYEKKRKVAPLDSLGSFQMSSFRNRKDEPDVYQEDHRE